MKFGGTSVASRDRWTTITAQARARMDAGERPVVVCSAISGVSDAIEDILRGCASGHPEDALTALRASIRRSPTPSESISTEKSARIFKRSTTKFGAQA